MRVISFDVGIKNMAYCILDISSNIEMFPSIVEWNVMNLIKSEDICHSSTCGMLTNKKKVCGKKAKYQKEITTITGTNTHIYSCEIHAKTHQTLSMPNKGFSLTALKKKSVQDVRVLQQKYLGENENIKKKADIVDNLYRHFEKHSWDPIKEKKVNAGHVDLITIGRNLFLELSQNDIMKTVTHVLIENQISPIANRMKTIQGMLAQHFISIGKEYIEFVSSGNKLKEFETISEAKTEYQKHKKDGVFFCTKLLQDHKYLLWYQYFIDFKAKKDDLADSFLQGIWWWKKFKKITNSSRNY
jgi:hypothetical protein